MLFLNCALIVVIAALAIYILVLRKDNTLYITKYAEHVVDTHNVERRLMFEIDELLKRDQVQAYNALEQGMTELGESYEADRLDLEEKIQRLEMERDFLLVQTDDVIAELTSRLEYMERVKKLHLETILAYQKDKEELIVFPNTPNMPG